MAMLRKRKSKSSARGPTRRKPRRVVNKSKADYARDRRREYTIHPVPPRRKRARRQSAWGPDGRRHDVVPVLNSRESLSKLIAAGYVNGKPDKCSKCGLQGSLTDPMGRSDEADGHLYYNCWTSYDRCNGRTNCMAIGNLPFVKMTPGQVHRAVDAYTNSDNQRPPSSDDIAGLCGGGRTQTAKLVTYLRNLEAQDGQRECENIRIGGDIEIDEHAVRTFHVSVNNKHYKHLEPKLKKGQKKPKYWLVYLRVIGIRQRGGGKTIVKFLPHKLLRPKAKPPPITKEELIESGLLKRCRKGSVIFSDGAKAYGSVINSMFKGKLISREVSHKNMEFTRRVMASGLNPHVSSFARSPSVSESTC